MQDLDQFRQFTGHRARVWPPRPIDIRTQLLCEHEPDGPGQAPRTRHAVHEDGGIATDESRWGVSENTGFFTGSAEPPSFVLNSDWWGCENRSDDFMEQVL